MKEALKKEVILGMVLNTEVGYWRMKLIHQEQFSQHFHWEAFSNPTGTVKATYYFLFLLCFILFLNFI